MTCMRWPRRRTALAEDSRDSREYGAAISGLDLLNFRVPGRLVTIPAWNAEGRRTTHSAVAEKAADEDVAAPHLVAIEDIYEDAGAEIDGIMDPGRRPSRPSAGSGGSPDSPADSDPSHGPEAERSRTPRRILSRPPAGDRTDQDRRVRDHVVGVERQPAGGHAARATYESFARRCSPGPVSPWTAQSIRATAGDVGHSRPIGCR
jgi:hypothetical protein